MNKRLRNNKWLLVLIISVMLWAAIALGLCAGLSLVFRVQAQVPEVRVIVPERQETQIHAESLVWVEEPVSFTPTEEELEERSWPELYYFTAGGYGSYGTPWKQVGDHYFSTK